MRKQILIAALLALAPLAACKSKSEPPAADNTAKNDRDRAITPTADNAGGGTDVDVTQKIRKLVVADGSLSTNAHNAKIVVQNGTVTLVGPVASAGEVQKVADLASSVVGPKNVINKLEVTN
jgi:osmotically-inducible protein OsmY